MSIRRLHRPVLCAAALCLCASSTAAQAIAGRVLDQATGRPLEGVHVVLSGAAGDTAGQAFSDEAGAFLLFAPRPGEWVVSAGLIGYGTVRSEPVGVTRDEVVEVEIRMAVEAVPVEPVVVTSRVSHRNPDIQAFYDRVEWGRQSGLGRYVTREEIERRMPYNPSDMLRTMAGIRIQRTRDYGGDIIRMSGGCIPAIYIDGTQINRLRASDSLDDYVTGPNLEGIEVYRGSNQQVGGYYDPRGCGLILVWTRRGGMEGGAFSWRKVLFGLGLILGVVLFAIS